MVHPIATCRALIKALEAGARIRNKAATLEELRELAKCLQQAVKQRVKFRLVMC